MSRHTAPRAVHKNLSGFAIRTLPSPSPAVRRLLSAVLLLFLTACTARGQFATNIAPTASTGAMSRQPAAVTFLELDANPLEYQNRLIRVTGAYMPAPEIACKPYKGPGIDWSLSEANLRLDVQGFARVISLLPEGTPVTVDGFWHRYDGPVGCGKEPPRQTLWVLHAVQIVQPNPLPQLAAITPTVAPEDEGETSTPEPTLEPDETPTITPSPSATPTVDLDLTPETTPVITTTLTLTPTPDLDETPTLTPTPDPDQTATPTPTPSPTTEPGGVTPPPPGATPTRGDYPAPGQTPSPTPDPYG